MQANEFLYCLSKLNVHFIKFQLQVTKHILTHAVPYMSMIHCREGSNSSLNCSLVLNQIFNSQGMCTNFPRGKQWCQENTACYQVTDKTVNTYSFIQQIFTEDLLFQEFYQVLEIRQGCFSIFSVNNLWIAWKLFQPSFALPFPCCAIFP